MDSRPKSTKIQEYNIFKKELIPFFNTHEANNTAARVANLNLLSYCFITSIDRWDNIVKEEKTARVWDLISKDVRVKCRKVNKVVGVKCRKLNKVVGVRESAGK